MQQINCQVILINYQVLIKVVKLQFIFLVLCKFIEFFKVLFKFTKYFKTTSILNILPYLKFKIVVNLFVA